MLGQQFLCMGLARHMRSIWLTVTSAELLCCPSSATGASVCLHYRGNVHSSGVVYPEKIEMLGYDRESPVQPVSERGFAAKVQRRGRNTRTQRFIASDTAACGMYAMPQAHAEVVLFRLAQADLVSNLPNCARYRALCSCWLYQRKSPILSGS